jgi:hypothetical protein
VLREIQALKEMGVVKVMQEIQALKELKVM